MVSALSVLCLVIDNRAFNLNFTGAEVSLEVGHIIISIPQAELNKREESYFLFVLSFILQYKLLDFTIVV